MEFVILGPTGLILNGRRVPLGVAKQRGLLAVLLLHAGSPVRVETIVECLWDGGPVEPRRASLYALASRTRAVLRAVGLDDALVRVPGTGAYRLNIDLGLIDFHRFRRLVDDARRAASQEDEEQSAALLAEAVDLWRDEPLADLHGAQSEHMRRNLTDALLGAQKRLIDGLLRLGRHEAALARLEPLVGPNDLDETLAQSWFTALHAAGRTTEARDFAVEFRRRFRRTFHAEPTLSAQESVDGAKPVATRLVSSQVGGPSGLTSTPHQLPADIGDFCGRRDLLLELDAIVDDGSPGPAIVILDGMPGAGKTTLATHWAHNQRHRFPDGQLYLNAEAYGPALPVTPEDALGRFLFALGVPPTRIPTTIEQRRERFNQIVNGRSILIVLDNVLTSDQARSLLPTSSTCVTVITSRNRLIGLTVREGVRSLTVAPLPEEDCVGLLRRLIGAERTKQQSAAVRALAVLSGGLPLALRIIGEHVAARPRARIADLVDQLGADLLDDDGGETEEAALQTVFAWSYNALEPQAARLFRLLGLYGGRSISSEAASALLGEDRRHAERNLNTLARAHLVSHDTARRYVVHDLIRLYAAHRARQDETEANQHAALRRLLAWYLLSATDAARVLAPHRGPVPDLPPAGAERSMTFDADADAMSWCESERPNLRAIVRAAADHGLHRYAWQIPGAVHEMIERFGRQDDVVEIHQIALVAAQADGHEIGQIGTHNNLGATYFATHDYQRAAEHFSAGLALARRVSYADAEASCSHNLASVYLKSGDANAAIRIYEEVLDKCRASDNIANQASILHRLGDAFRQTEQYHQSERCYLEALDLRERLGSLRGQGATQSSLAALCLDTDRPRDAIAHCVRALELHQVAIDESQRCFTLTTLADAHRRLGSYADAALNARAAITVSDEIADSYRRAHALAVLADVYLATGDLEAAQTHCSAALGSLEEGPGAEKVPIRARLAVTRSALCREPMSKGDGSELP